MIARWNPASIALHWASATVIVALLAVGWSQSRLFDVPTRFDLYQLHKSLGVLALSRVF